MTTTNNVRQYSVSKNLITLLGVDLWPDLRTARWGPACGATSYNLVVAGGLSEWDDVLRSVEVYNIKQRSIRKGGSLREARAYFRIIPVGSKYPRLLAVGGQSTDSSLATSEWWEEEEDSWQAGPSLSTGRSNFGLLMAPPQLACPETEPINYSCPADADTEEMCTFSNLEGIML